LRIGKDSEETSKFIFYSPLNAKVGAENCTIAAFHAILMAQVLNGRIKSDFQEKLLRLPAGAGQGRLFSGTINSRDRG
jgi:hypothetical protein